MRTLWERVFLPSEPKYWPERDYLGWHRKRHGFPAWGDGVAKTAPAGGLRSDKDLLDNLDPCCNVQEEFAGPDGEILRAFDKRLHFPASLLNIQFVYRVPE